MALKIIKNQAEFDSEVLNAKKPVLVDFWATWCGPCKMLAPLLEQLAAAHPEMDVAKVNVDENTDLAMAYRVAAIPTLLLFKEGKAVKQSVGYIGMAELKQMIS